MRSFSSSVSRRFITFTAIIIAVGCLSTSVNAALLIPASGHRDHAYDITRGLLYISNNSGQVLRYDLTAETFLTPFNVGVNLNGIDLTPDGAFAYVAESQAGATQGLIRKVFLDTGNRINLPYTRHSLESGAYAVVAAGDKVFFTTQFAGSGWTPMRVIDTADDTMQIVASVRQNTNISAAADGSKVFFTESNSSGGPAGIVDVATLDVDTIRFNSFLGSTQHAVSRNGQLIAVEYGGTTILNDDLTTAEILPAFNGGLAFNPVRDILYAADSATDELVAIDTTTFAELYRLDAGGDIGSSGHLGAGPMSVSPDGRHVFLNTSEGVRVFEVNDVPEPTTGMVMLALVSTVMSRRRRGGSSHYVA